MSEREKEVHRDVLLHQLNCVFCWAMCLQFQVFLLTAVVAMVLQIAIPVQSLPAGQSPANATEQLDVNPDVIGPVDSPLKHLEKAQSDKKYVDFINDLYKNDKSKTPLTFESH